MKILGTQITLPSLFGRQADSTDQLRKEVHTEAEKRNRKLEKQYDEVYALMVSTLATLDTPAQLPSPTRDLDKEKN